MFTVMGVSRVILWFKIIFVVILLVFLVCIRRLFSLSSNERNTVGDQHHPTDNESRNEQGLSMGRKKKKNRRRRKPLSQNRDGTTGSNRTVRGISSGGNDEEDGVLPGLISQFPEQTTSRKKRNRQRKNARGRPVAKDTHHKARTQLVPYSSKFAEQQKKFYWKTCWFCEAQGYDKKKCQRCELAWYCHKECQMKDYQRHKSPCAHLFRFASAKSRVNPDLLNQLFNELGFKEISFFLGSIPDATRYLITGPRICVLVEIVEAFVGVQQFGVKVRDVTNHTSVVTLDMTEHCAKVGFLTSFLDLLRMAALLQPGNFLLLFNIFWQFYEHKAANLIVKDVNNFLVVLM